MFDRLCHIPSSAILSDVTTTWECNRETPPGPGWVDWSMFLPRSPEFTKEEARCPKRSKQLDWSLKTLQHVKRNTIQHVNPLGKYGKWGGGGAKTLCPSG